MTLFLALAIWIFSAIAVGVTAHRHNRSYLGWLMVSLLVSPLIALPVLLYLSSSAKKDYAERLDNPYAVATPRHGAYIKEPVQPAEVVQVVQTSTPSLHPRMIAGVAALAFALVAPGVWISTSLQASPDARSTAAAYSLPQDIVDLAWEAPSSFPLSETRLRYADTLASKTLPTPVPAFEGGIVTHIANLRAGPSTDSAITGLLDQGAAVEIAAQNKDGDWYQLTSGDWIAAFLVTRTGNLSLPETTLTATLIATCSPCTGAEDGRAAVNVPQANLRSGPGTGFGVVGTLDIGQTLDLAGVSNDGDWYRLADGRWIYAELVSDAPQDLAIVTQASSRL